MRIIDYSVECPKCKVSGVTRTLGFDPDAGGVCCDAPEPHVYEELPGSESRVSGPSGVEVARPDLAKETQQTGGTPEVLPGSGESEQSRFSEIVRDRSKVEDTPLVAEPQSAIDVIEQAINNGKKVELAPSGEVTISPRVGLSDVAELPGGDVLFGLRISEQWRSAIQAAADNSDQSFSEYLQDFINNFALLNEWASEPTPK